MRLTKFVFHRVLSARRILIKQSQTFKMASIDYADERVGDRYKNNQNLPKVVHLSENFLCVDKGYDIKVNFNDPEEITVEHQLRKMYPELVDPTVGHSFRYCHRLDYATSGLLCLALNKKAARVMAHEFKSKNVTKFYLALVRGHLQDDVVFVDVPTGDLEDEEWPGRRCVLTHPACSKPKVTETLVVRLETGSFDGDPATKVLLKPITGKQHQLRVHCDFIGHTIIGDYTYSLRQDTKPQRMMLHSYRLLAETKLENLDLITEDPFTPNVIPDWMPDNIYQEYQAAEKMATRFIPYETDSVKNVILRCDDG